ncbi:MAG: T9SS type A sorting domain-containing protein [Bacteroidia bacterium]
MKSLITSFFVFLSFIVFSQTERNVIVEHFTNTNCSVCGSRNPKLHSNLANSNSDVIHISYHPSRPYNDCKLNNHNGAENDDRTKFYDIYGSTPQIVIQGETKPRANFDNTGLFDDYKGKLASFNSKTTFEMGDDSMYVKVVLMSEITTDWTSVKLAVMAVEDTVNYKGRNSETVHYNVFRKSFTGVEGVSTKSVIEFGDSAVYFYAIAISNEWITEQMSTITIIQNTANKSIEQAEKGKKGRVQKTVGLSNSANKIGIFPTLVNDKISILSADRNAFEIYNLNGKLIQNGIATNTITLDNLEKGMYILKLQNVNGTSIQRFIKE